MHHDDLAARFAAFGWNALSVPGNDIDALLEAFEQAKKTKGCPTVVIANTTKGGGVSFMENRAEWHHKVPDEAQYQAAVRELSQREAGEHSQSAHNKEVLRDE